MKKSKNNRKPLQADFEYFINIVGLDTDSIGLDFTIDNKYELGGDLYGSLTIMPFRGEKKPTFEEIIFYTNCLAYEHDLPSFIFPIFEKRKALIYPIANTSTKYKKEKDQSYYDDMSMIYEEFFNIKYGVTATIYFKWLKFIERLGNDEKFNIPYTKKYHIVKREISLYSNALRQINPLSEFLDYYRVIESVSGNNGKQWIAKKLSKLKNYNFGFVAISTNSLLKTKIKNIFVLYKKRAISRLNYLKDKLNLTNQKIAEYFYYTIRCGIAHGRRGVRVFDFKTDITTISKDNFILKLLARIAIEEKIRGV